MQPLIFPYVLFASIGLVFATAALFTYRVEPLFGYTHNQLSGPAHSFAVALIALLLVSNLGVSPEASMAILMYSGAGILVPTFIVFRMLDPASEATQHLWPLAQDIGSALLAASFIYALAHGQVGNLSDPALSMTLLSLLTAGLLGFVTLRKRQTFTSET